MTSALDKKARNREENAKTKKLKELLPIVLEETGAESLQSLHGHFSAHKAKYIDLINDVIPSAEHYISLFIEGLKKHLLVEGATSYKRFYNNLMGSDVSKEYLYLFLYRTYLREYENLSKNRPDTNSSDLWIGQNNADYGLLVTPRYVKGQWENDKSEIRRFNPSYWSIGHVLETGLVIPDRDEKITFAGINEYLSFFENTLVRHSGSEYQRRIAKMYSDYVRQANSPEDILLLIPELRYEGRDKKHKYRLDFCVVDVDSNNKIGFEISPWSSHGKLTGIKDKKQYEINKEASENFDKEMKKHKDYFRKHGIFCLILFRVLFPAACCVIYSHERIYP